MFFPFAYCISKFAQLTRDSRLFRTYSLKKSDELDLLDFVEITYIITYKHIREVINDQ